MYSLQVKRNIQAPRDIIWEVISDLNHYSDYASNLSRTEVVSGKGVGLIRQCADNRGGEWNETCTLWDEGQRYSFEVDTSPSDYPYPFTFLKGTWGIEETDDSPTLVMRFDYQPKGDLPIIGWSINRFVLHRAFKPIAEDLLDKWEHEILKRSTMPD